MSSSDPVQSSPSRNPEDVPPSIPPVLAGRPATASAIKSNAGSDYEPGGGFWARYKTLVNFWLDVGLLVIFLLLAWELAVLRFAFPKGATDKWKLLGHTATDWQDLAFNTFCVFALGVVLHVMLHWAWIVGTIQTRLLRRRATKDDGSHTMIGVGFLFVLIHILAGGILWARWAIVEQS